MREFFGKGVYGAVAIGKISVIKKNGIKAAKYTVEDIEAELIRLENAKEKARRELLEIYEKALKEVGETNARIFEIHEMLLDDDDYNEAIEGLIKGQRVNAEYAVAETAKNFAEMFSKTEDSYMRARAADIEDISNRLLGCLSSENGDKSRITGGTVICADDLLPSETVALDKDSITALATADGSPNSHTAILARNMNIPAIVGLGKEFIESVKDGAEAAVDGATGRFVLEPDKETVEYYRLKQSEDEEQRKLLEELNGKENVTLDGRRINIYANIGSADGIGAVLSNDAGGIGLFRSEFLYLGRTDFPSEEEQYKVYRRVLESMASKKVIIRTLDIGADKKADYFGLESEDNPALGLRAIRLCLQRPEMFKTQLRALFRASVCGNLAIMFPMIVSKWEIEKVLSVCEEVKRELTDEGKAFSDVETGVMIETPAAALISDKLAPLVDFFSIGTNDLIQYTLACDRQNPRLEPFCDTHHEAVLKLIEMTVENGHKGGAWVGICGELAADLSLTERFLKMGIDELSVSPPFVLKLRDTVRKIDLGKV